MLLSILTLILITFFFFELNHKFNKDSPLILKPIEFKKDILDSKVKYIALVEISNIHKKMEVMIPFFKVNPYLIGIPNDEIIKVCHHLLKNYTFLEYFL